MSAIVQPHILAELRKRLGPVAVQDTPFGFASYAGVKVYEKPGQKAAAWCISDEKLVQAYLTGKVDEAELHGLSKGIAERFTDFRIPEPAPNPPGKTLVEVFAEEVRGRREE